RLLQEQRRVEERAAGAAVLLADLEAVPAQLAHPGGDRVGVAAVGLLVALARGEVADGLDERALLVRETVVGAGDGHGDAHAAQRTPARPAVRPVPGASSGA